MTELVLASRRSCRRKAYPEELKAFALTLHFYSAKAHDFIRQTFHMALQHRTLIRSWYDRINGDPGFTQCALAALSAQVKEEASKDRKTNCEYHGFVDVGNGQQDDSAPLAKDTLVLMAVSVNASWKIPVGYFLFDGMSGSERVNVVCECLQRPHTTGVHVVSLTCDGPSCHFSMLKDLKGCTLPVYMLYR